MTSFQIYMTIGALISVGFHRFIMSDLRGAILNDALDELGEYRKTSVFLVFALVALIWPIFVIQFMIRR